MTECYVGLMSGTSMDAVDAVLVDFSQTPPNVLGSHTVPLDAGLRAELRALAQPGHDEIRRMLGADAAVAECFAQCTLALLDKCGMAAGDVIALGSHGQTIRHIPDGRPPATLQIGDPNRLAELTGITTVGDFRRRDMAAGGEGAPLVPAFHHAIFGDNDEDRVVINIGGIGNVSILPSHPETPVTGFDTGPGNTLLDAWTRRHLDQPMDRNGEWAAGGKTLLTLLASLMGDPWFALPPPKSTGPELFNLDWLDASLKQLADVPDARDVQATLCQLTASTIADAITGHAPATRRILLCGGGALNQDLVRRIGNALDGRAVESTHQHGIDPGLVEAMAFAWLARERLEERPGNLPAVTGARHPVILGGIFAGNR